MTWKNTKFELSLQFAKKLADWKMQLSGSWGQPCLLCCVVLCCVVLHCAVLYCVMCYWLQVSLAPIQTGGQFTMMSTCSGKLQSGFQTSSLQFTIYNFPKFTNNNLKFETCNLQFRTRSTCTLQFTMITTWTGESSAILISDFEGPCAAVSLSHLKQRWEILKQINWMFHSHSSV